MRTKNLKSATIIPDKLYTLRDADRQLHRVLDDMGRPGYVLVSRQMGKTNLLLHAKRSLQNERDIFIYLDLSGSYRTTYECFRSIIDTAIETHPQTFSSIKGRIASERDCRDLPAHKEHEAELRTLLSATPGKIVIILDEIDALTRSDYSDQIFSQIRSTYFARANFPEYQRLTYILSGVAEPTEIIKNPNLSPFNIGEKIYLDDFNRGEFEKFIASAELNFSEEVRTRVFEWTNGNPRITWDLCSELENQIISDLPVSACTVDETVHKLYLTAFDKPPIDHIRTLAENDKEIRNAITQIRYKKGDTLNDSVRTRLYLAGIIQSDIRSPKIKNRIIDASLSDQWLSHVESKKSDSISIAIELIRNTRYADAATLLRKYIDETREDPRRQARARPYLGIALTKNGDYKEALPHIELVIESHDRNVHPELIGEQTYLLSMCLTRLGSIDIAIEKLEELLSSNYRESPYYAAILTLSSIYEAHFPEQKHDRILELNRTILRETPALESTFGQEPMRQHRALARFYIANRYKKSNNKIPAKQAIKEGIEDAPSELRPRLLLEYYQLETDPGIRAETLAQILESILSSSVEIKPPHPDFPLALDTDTFTTILAIAYSSAPREAFQRLLDRAISQSTNPPKKRIEQLFELAVHMFQEKDFSAARSFLSTAFNLAIKATDLDRATFEDIVRLTTYFNSSNDVFREYIKTLETPSKPHKVTALDAGACIKGVQQLQRTGLHQEALSAVAIAIPRLGTNMPEAIIYLEHLAIESHRSQGNPAKVRQCARNILDLAPYVRPSKSATLFVDAASISFFIARAERMIHGEISEKSQADRKIKRNEQVVVKYRDGREVQGKYKKLEADIESGQCKLIGFAQ